MYTEMCIRWLLTLVSDRIEEVKNNCKKKTHHSLHYLTTEQI